MKQLGILGMAALSSLASGCASLQSISVTNIPRERGRLVEAEATNPAFLGIHFSNGFADGLTDELRAQCPNGRVSGIYAKYESRWYVLVQSRIVTVRGYCVAKEQPVAALAPPPAPQPEPLAPSSPTHEAPELPQ